MPKLGGVLLFGSLVSYGSSFLDAGPQEVRKEIMSKPVVDVPPSELTCSSSKLYRGDTLKIKMSVPHGGDLNIQTRTNTYYVVWWEPNHAAKVQPFIDRERFRTLALLDLPVDSFEAPSFYGGPDKTSRVFTKSDTYVLVLGENLETDDGTPSCECTVEYFDEPKPLPNKALQRTGHTAPRR